MSPNPSDSAKQPGTPPQPSGDGSQAASVQPGSGTGALTKADLDAFRAQLLNDVRAAAQSDKDRAVKNTNKRLDGLEEKLQPLLQMAAGKIAAGASVDQAINEVTESARKEAETTELRETLQAVKEKLESGNLPSSTAGTGPGKGVDVTEVVKKFNFDRDDVDANALIQRFGTDAERLEVELERLSLKRQSSPPASESPSPSGKTSRSVGPNEVLVTKIAKSVESGNVPDRFEFLAAKKKLDEEGWPTS